MNSLETTQPPRYRTALIVDDSPAVVTALATRCSANQWNCMTALDGHDAMSLLRERVPDAVVTDLDMPYVDGFSLLEIAETFLSIPAVAVTGSHHAATQCLRDFPNVPLLMKPFDAKQVLAALDRITPTPHSRAA